MSTSGQVQSSVEWFQEQIIKIVNGTCLLSEIEVFEQAKAMHEEEIKKAWDNAAIDATYGNKFKNFEEYYNETFKI